MASNGAKSTTRTRVGKYELGKTLGEGSFGKVKFAKDVTSGAFVAIKILDRDQVLRHKMVEQVNTNKIAHRNLNESPFSDSPRRFSLHRIACRWLVDSSLIVLILRFLHRI